MKMSFTLDGCHELEINGDVPRTVGDPASVCLNLLHTPLPTKMEMADVQPRGGYGWIQAPTVTLMSVSLKPSHARAIASALLSAATEAKA